MGKFDALLKKAEMFEKLAVYGDRKAFLNALSQEDPWAAARQKLEEEKGLPPATIPPPPQQVSVPHFTRPAPAMQAAPDKSYPSFPKETQTQLNELLVPGGDIFMLDVDGKLGPNTRAALAKFTAKYNMPATPENIKQVHTLKGMRFPTKG